MNGTTRQRLRDFRAPAVFACTVLLVAGLAGCGAASQASENPAKTGTTCPTPEHSSPSTGVNSMAGMNHAPGAHPSANPGTGNCGSGGS